MPQPHHFRWWGERTKRWRDAPICALLIWWASGCGATRRRGETRRIEVQVHSRRADVLRRIDARRTRSDGGAARHRSDGAGTSQVRGATRCGPSALRMQRFRLPRVESSASRRFHLPLGNRTKLPSDHPAGGQRNRDSAAVWGPVSAWMNSPTAPEAHASRSAVSHGPTPPATGLVVPSW